MGATTNIKALEQESAESLNVESQRKANMITLDDIQVKLNHYNNHSTIPDPNKFHAYMPNHVFDFDKSVRWNMQKAAEMHQPYSDELIRLSNEHDKLFIEVFSLIKQYIMQETGCNEKQAALINQRAIGSCDRGYSDDNFIDRLDDIIIFCKEFKGLEKYDVKEGC